MSALMTPPACARNTSVTGTSGDRVARELSRSMLLRRLGQRAVYPFRSMVRPGTWFSTRPTAQDPIEYAGAAASPPCGRTWIAPTTVGTDAGPTVTSAPLTALAGATVPSRAPARNRPAREVQEAALAPPGRRLSARPPGASRGRRATRPP